MTKYFKLEEMRDHLLTYLKEQKQFLQDDIDASSQLTDDEKIDNGLLIVDATVLRHEDNEYLLGFKVNNTKVRPGDEVTLESSDGQKLIVSVIENELESMTIQYDGVLSLSLSYRISVNNIVMLDPLINLLEGIASGLPGAYFLKLLANIEEPDEEGFTTLDVLTPATPASTTSSRRFVKRYFNVRLFIVFKDLRVLARPMFLEFWHERLPKGEKMSS